MKKPKRQKIYWTDRGSWQPNMIMKDMSENLIEIGKMLEEALFVDVSGKPKNPLIIKKGKCKQCRIFGCNGKYTIYGLCGCGCHLPQSSRKKEEK